MTLGAAFVKVFAAVAIGCWALWWIYRGPDDGPPGPDDGAVYP